MNTEDNESDRTYEAWLANRRRVQAPEDLADRVMASLQPRPRESRWWDTWGRAALLAGAALVGVARFCVMAFAILYS